MKLPPRLIAALAFALLARAPLPAADLVDIQQHWVAGKKYYQTTRTAVESKFEIGADKMDESSNMTLDLTMTVSPPVTGQPKRMTIRYERAAMQVIINGQKFGFDSADPSTFDDPLGLAKSAGAMVGKELKLVLDENDEVTKIENYDEFVKSVTPAAEAGSDATALISRDSFTEMLKEGGLSAVPGKPIPIGGTWSFHTRNDLAQLGTVSVTGTYTLQGVGDHNGTKCAEISVTGKLSMDLPSSAVDGDKAAPESKVTDGTLQGTVWFDPQLGIARDTQLVHEMTISTGADRMPMKQTISVTLTKVEDVK
jgi:hypothetical protein